MVFRVAGLKGGSYGDPGIRSGAWVGVRTPGAGVVLRRVAIRVAIGSVVGVVGEVEGPILRVVGVTHAGLGAREVLRVVSFDDRVRRLSC